MNAKQLKAFLDTLPEDTEIKVSLVADDGKPDRLEIDAVLLVDVLPAISPLRYDGGVYAGTAYLCTWRPAWKDQITPAGEYRPRTKVKEIGEKPAPQNKASEKS